MTFFLTEQTPKRRGPNVALPSNWSGVGAAITTYFRETDNFNGIQARTEMEKVFVGKDAGERLGVDKLNQWYQENDAGYDHLRPAPTSVDDFIEMHGERGADIILDVARQEAAVNPDAWADLDVSQEGIDTRVTEGLKASAADDAELLGLSPNPVRNALLGSLAAGVMDPVNLAAIPLGLGGGSILRTMGREAMINGGIEALQHPARVRTAERLDQEAPSLVESVASGMVFGAAIGGALEAIPRGLRAIAYYREMKKVAKDPTISPVTQEAAIQSAERAIVAGDDPLKAVRKAVLAEPPPARRPLILDESMAVTPEPTALAPDPITTAPLEPVPGVPNTVDQITAVAKSGIAKGSAPKKPVLSWMKTQGVDPEGWLGTELKARGWNHKTYPGLFKKGGITDIDNLVADDLDQSIPGISWLAGKDESGNYLDRDGLLRVLDDEVAGRASTGRRAYARDYEPERAFNDPDVEDRGFVVDLSRYQFDDPNWQARMEADVEAHLESKGIVILPRERDEIMGILRTRGGDVEDLLYSAMARELDDADYAVLRAMRGEAYGRPDVPRGEETGVGRWADSPSGEPSGRSEAAAGNAPEPGARAGELAVERTDIGDQYVVPGTRRVDEYSKHIAKAQAETKALQSAMRSSKPQSRVEADEGGLFGGAQRDMFSEPADPKSKPAQIGMIESLRDETIAEDFMVNVDGKPIKASALVKEMDDDLDFEDILNACGKRGPQ